MGKTELILQFIKTFIWPVVVIVIILVFKQQVTNILSGAVEAEFFGVKIKGDGQAIAQLETKRIELEKKLKEVGDEFEKLKQTNSDILTENNQLRTALEKQNKEIEVARSSGKLEEQYVQQYEIPERNMELEQKNQQLNKSLYENLKSAQDIVLQKK